MSEEATEKSEHVGEVNSPTDHPYDTLDHDIKNEIPSHSDRVGHYNKTSNINRKSTKFNVKNVSEYYEQQKGLAKHFADDQKLLSTRMDFNPIRIESLPIWERNFLIATFLIDFGLFVLKSVCSILSLSIALFSTTLESFLDILSTLTVYFTNRLRIRKSKLDTYHFPVGKSRAEPIGIIIFASVMATLSLQIAKESLQSVIAFASNPPSSPPIPGWQQYVGIACLAFTLVVKLCMYVAARLQTGSKEILHSSIDHRNDVITNAMLLLISVLAKFLYPQYIGWLESVGALLMCLYIVVHWTIKIYEYAVRLVGQAADPTFLKRVIKVAMDHHHQITHVERVSAFYVGLGLFVEVDIVLDPKTPLRESHDIGESLQLKLERLPGVERCFVHLDHEVDHKPEIEHKIIN
jgi:cation diffusion facilitator family transporter